MGRTPKRRQEPDSIERPDTTPDRGLVAPDGNLASLAIFWVDWMNRDWFGLKGSLKPADMLTFNKFMLDVYCMLQCGLVMTRTEAFHIFGVSHANTLVDHLEPGFEHGLIEEVRLPTDSRRVVIKLTARSVALIETGLRDLAALSPGVRSVYPERSFLKGGSRFPLGDQRSAPPAPLFSVDLAADERTLSGSAHPDHIRDRIRLADRLFDRADRVTDLTVTQRGVYDLYIRTYSATLKLYPGNHAARLGHAHFNYTIGQYDIALADLASMIKERAAGGNEHAFNAKILLDKAILDHAKLGSADAKPYDQARFAITNYITANAGALFGKHVTASLEFYTGQYDSAETALSAIINECTVSKEAFRMRGVTRLRHRKLDAHADFMAWRDLIDAELTDPTNMTPRRTVRLQKDRARADNMIAAAKSKQSFDATMIVNPAPDDRA
jgi:hypothetical protein